MTPQNALEEIADAILDGCSVDWGALESSGPAVDPALIEQLRTLAAVKVAGLTWAREIGTADTWGHLRVLEPIGAGAFGEVFRAWDTRLDREVALKLLPPDSATVAYRSSSVIEEGRLLARVRHPNVVTIHGAERIAGRVGLWMEFVKGCTLEQLVRQGKRFTAKEVTRIGVELCRAVSAVHDAGLVHRDIKAQNVMVADDGRLVLMDFGAGRELDDSEGDKVAGTPLYLAPEVLAGGVASAASDVYGIGVLMYHLLTGSFPVQAANLDDLRRAHDARVRMDVRSVRADVPRRLARSIERACDPDPNRRYGSADSFGDALASLESAPSVVRRVYAAAAAVALVAVGVVAWHFATRASQSDGAIAVAGAASATSKVPRVPIAVLPFINRAADPGSDDFVEGLTREVIRTLGTINGLHVVSATSSLASKGRPVDVQLVAAKFGVDVVVEAEVLQIARRLQINARLVRVSDRTPLWQQQFDGRLGDVFRMQDEMAHGIASAMAMSPVAGRLGYQLAPDASALYFRARALVNRRGLENAQRAAALFEQIIEISPEFAPAHAGAVDAYAEMSWQIQTGDGPPALEYEEALRRMRPAAMRALELDPDLAEAHAAMGLTYAREFDWVRARASFLRGIERNRALTHVQTRYALSVLLPLGEVADAVQLLEASLRGDPLSLDVRRVLAIAQIVAGDYEQAIQHLRRVLDVDPDYPHASLLLARALTLSGRLKEAEGIWSTRGAPGRIWSALMYVKAGRPEEAERLLDPNDLPHRQAVVYAALGDTARTLDALNRAADTVPQRTVLMLVYPEMAFLRGHPGMVGLRKRFNLQ